MTAFSNWMRWQRRLSVIGYDREVQVEGSGQFAVRGGILDIYPLTEELPVRIELWGDEVDSIRTFDVESQRSIENLMDIVHLSGGRIPTEWREGCLVSGLFSNRRYDPFSG